MTYRFLKDGESVRNGDFRANLCASMMATEEARYDPVPPLAFGRKVGIMDSGWAWLRPIDKEKACQ